MPDFGHMRACASYEGPYLGPEGGRPGRPTQAVRNTCSGKLEILKYYAILGQTCTLSLQQTRSYYVLPNVPTLPTLSYTGHTLKQSNLIKREQTGQSLQSTSCN